MAAFYDEQGGICQAFMADGILSQANQAEEGGGGEGPRGSPPKRGAKVKRKSKSRKALLGDCDEWVGKNAAIEDYIAGKRSLTDNELRQLATAAFREAYGKLEATLNQDDKDKISSAVGNIMEYKDHRVNNNLATVNCRKRKQAKLEQEKASFENERALRIEAEERARKAELRVKELEAQVRKLKMEIFGSEEDAEIQALQEDLDDVWGKEVTEKLLTSDDVDNMWNRCHEDDQ